MSTSEFFFKIVLLGETNVGKTNLLYRYCKQTFLESSKPTIGIDYLTQDKVVANRAITIHFWDTAGQEKFRGLKTAYYKNCQGVVLIFDITSRFTFESLEKWIEEVKDSCEVETQILILGNKSDLATAREVNVDEAIAFAEKNKCKYYEVSAKTNDQNLVNVAIDEFIANILEMQMSPEVLKKMERLQTIKQKASVSLKQKNAPSRQNRCC